MRLLGLLLLALPLFSGCRGTSPQLNGPPEAGIASVLIACRVALPTGETLDGKAALNLEGEEGNGETYRLPLKPNAPLLFQVEPGVYRLAPTRSLFGFHQANLKIKAEGRTYTVPFPREILRKAALNVKPARIVPIGTLDVKVLARAPGRPATVRVSLDDSIRERRRLVQEVIRTMMDPRVDAGDRANAVAWTRALEASLSELLVESDRAPAFRRGE